jgi:predicted RNA-binding protein YlqC (UPF0109 family)
MELSRALHACSLTPDQLFPDCKVDAASLHARSRRWRQPVLQKFIHGQSICIARTAFPITSAGRFWPLGPRGHDTILAHGDYNPEQVSVRLIEGEQTTVFELRVAQSDFGKIIGKHGRTASSIQTIISAAGAKLKRIHA